MITGINHITLAVADIKQAFRFYTEVLGCQTVMRSDTSAYVAAGSLWIALHLDPGHRPAEAPDYSHVALDAATGEYKEMVRRLKRHGVVQWQANSTRGESFYFLDPDGHRLEIHVGTLQKRVKHGKADWGEDVEWFA